MILKLSHKKNIMATRGSLKSRSYFGNAIFNVVCDAVNNQEPYQNMCEGPKFTSDTKNKTIGKIPKLDTNIDKSSTVIKFNDLVRRIKNSKHVTSTYQLIFLFLSWTEIKDKLGYYAKIIKELQKDYYQVVIVVAEHSYASAVSGFGKYRLEDLVWRWTDSCRNKGIDGALIRKHFDRFSVFHVFRNTDYFLKLIDVFQDVKYKRIYKYKS